jgi:hypothetical protein
MSVELKKIGLYGTVGVLLAALIIAGLAMVPGVEIPIFTARTGTLVVKLTDAPVELTSLVVTIDRVSVQSEEDAWLELEFVGEPPPTEVTIDLLTLQDVVVDLSVTKLPAGKYTLIGLHVSTAIASYNGVVDQPLIVPSEVIKVIIHFEIVSGEITTILVDMTGHISATNRLSPVLKATVI